MATGDASDSEGEKVFMSKDASAPRSRSSLLWKTLNYLLRVLGRLRFVPFSAIFLFLGSAVRFLQLRFARRLGVCVKLDGASVAMLPALLFALSRERKELAYAPLDCHFQFSAIPDGGEFFSFFSTLLAVSEVRSISFYFHQDAFIKDEYLLRSRAERAGGPAQIVKEGGLTGPLSLQPFTLPTAANRDSETLLKRTFGSAIIICDNTVSSNVVVLRSIVDAHPDVRIAHLKKTTSLRKEDMPLGQWGLTPFDQLAILRSSDCYIGPLDSFGIAATLLQMPRIIVTDDREGEIKYRIEPDFTSLVNCAPPDSAVDVIAYVRKASDADFKQ